MRTAIAGPASSSLGRVRVSVRMMILYTLGNERVEMSSLCLFPWGLLRV